MCKVSIIMPVYNKENYIEKTLEAIQNQKYTDWELIIINDGSTDDSDKIIEKYACQNKQIHYISQSNKGVSVARNEGLKKASGEWIWFVDADDLPDQEFIYNVFSKEYDRDVDIIVGSYECLKKDGIIKKVEIEERGTILTDRFPEVFMKYQYSSGFWGFLWNKLLKREFIEKKECQFKEGLTLAEDIKFMIGLYRQGAMIYSTSYNAMRYTEGAINSSVEKKIDFEKQLILQIEIKDWIVNDNNKLEYADHFKKIISNYVAFNIFYRYEEDGECREIVKSLLKDIKVNSQLDTKNVEGTMLPIVWCLIHKSYFLLKSYLYIRKEVRNIYRFLIKKD